MDGEEDESVAEEDDQYYEREGVDDGTSEGLRRRFREDGQQVA